jgi:hypothetical protein
MTFRETGKAYQLREPPIPYGDHFGAKNAPLAKARTVLKDILEMAKKTKALDEKLMRLTKAEKKLLKKEQETE